MLYISLSLIIFHMQAHDWNPKCAKPFIHMKRAKRFYIKSIEQRRKFVQFLANNLPWRTLYSVFHRFKHLYGNHEKIFQRYHPYQKLNAFV